MFWVMVTAVVFLTLTFLDLWTTVALVRHADPEFEEQNIFVRPFLASEGRYFVLALLRALISLALAWTPSVAVILIYGGVLGAAVANNLRWWFTLASRTSGGGATVDVAATLCAQRRA